MTSAAGVTLRRASVQDAEALAARLHGSSPLLPEPAQ